MSFENFEKRFVGGPDGILREEELTEEQKTELNRGNSFHNKAPDILYGDEEGVLRKEKPKAKWKEDLERTTGKPYVPKELPEKLKSFLKNKGIE